jgi:hypothetical protein
MNHRALEFRDSKHVVMGYIIAPIAGLLSLWASIVAYDFLGPNFNIVRDILILPWIFMVGGFLCALVEIIIILPLVAGFSKYQWRWLNGWSASAIGFFLSAFPWLTFSGWHILSGSPAHSAWLEAILQSMACGLVGLVGAIVFRMIAVRAVLE